MSNAAPAIPEFAPPVKSSPKLSLKSPSISQFEFSRHLVRAIAKVNVDSDKRMVAAELTERRRVTNTNLDLQRTQLINQLFKDKKFTLNNTGGFEKVEAERARKEEERRKLLLTQAFYNDMDDDDDSEEEPELPPDDSDEDLTSMVSSFWIKPQSAMEEEDILAKELKKVSFM